MQFFLSFQEYNNALGLQQKLQMQAVRDRSPAAGSPHGGARLRRTTGQTESVVGTFQGSAFLGGDPGANVGAMPLQLADGEIGLRRVLPSRVDGDEGSDGFPKPMEAREAHEDEGVSVSAQRRSFE